MRELAVLWRLHRPRWRWLLVGALLMLIPPLANFGLLALSGWFITATGLAGLAGTALDIYRPGAGIRFFAITRAVGRYGERLVTHEAVLRLLADLRVRVFRRLMGATMLQLRTLRTGDTLTRLTADVDRLDQFYLRVLAPSAVAVLGLIVVTAVLTLIAPRAAVAVAAVLIPVALAGAILTGAMARGPGQEILRLGSRLREHVVRTLDGLTELHIYAGTDAAVGHFRALDADYEGAQRRLARLAGLTQTLGNLGSLLTLWLAAFLVIPLVADGELSGAEFALVLLSTLALAELLTPLPLAAQALTQTRAAARRVFTTAPPEHAQTTDDAGPGDGSVSLNGIRQRVEADAAAVLEDLSLALNPGDHVAISGASGSGKSTLLALAAGIRSPEQGRVLLGGVDVAALTPEAVGQRAAWLPQESIVFNDTVAGNLLLADPDAAEQRLWDALGAVAMASTVAAFSDGLGTLVGAGGRALSGGEARRLCLARTLLQPSPILLLDEPTRGLDRETAVRVLNGILHYAGDRTILMVTHEPQILPDGVTRRTLADGRLQPTV